MAGEWIKFENVTCDKPEVFLMAEELGIDPDAVIGKLVRVWVWADQQTVDGHAPGVTRALLDRLTCVTGFAAAMLSVGWLSDTDGGLTFPRFENHNGQTAKSRAMAAKRSAKRRASRSQRDATVTSSVTSALPREEKRREEVNTPHTPREAEPENLELDGLTPDARSPGGQPWNEAEAEFVAEWNTLPTGKRGVVPVYGLPPTMSVKDREAFREAWRTKAEPARRAMAAIAAGAIQWDRSAMTIRAFFNSELDTILGGGHARHEQPVRRNPEAARGGRVDSSSDLDELLARSAKIQSDQRTAAGVGA